MYALMRFHVPVYAGFFCLSMFKGIFQDFHCIGVEKYNVFC